MKEEQEKRRKLLRGKKSKIKTPTAKSKMLSQNLALVLPLPPSWDLRESKGRSPASLTPSGGIAGKSEEGRREPLGGWRRNHPRQLPCWVPSWPPAAKSQEETLELVPYKREAMKTPVPEEDYATSEHAFTAALGAAHRCQGCAVP